jgi:hypothetical protein
MLQIFLSKTQVCRAAISKRERLWCIPVRERKGLRLALRKGLERKARTTTAGRRRTCSGKPDRRVERGLRPNVLTGILPFAVLYAGALPDGTGHRGMVSVFSTNMPGLTAHY